MPDSALTIFTALIAIGTAAAAVAAWRSAAAARTAADASRQATEATLVTSFLKDYASSQMNEALGVIRQHIDQPENKEPLEAIAALPYEQITDGIPAGFSVDPAVNRSRRKIHYYFKTAYNLHAKEYILLRSLRLIADVPAYQLLHRYIKPLSLVANPEWRKETPNIETIRKRFAWFDWYRENIGEGD